MTDPITQSTLVRWLHEFGSRVRQGKSYLTELDAAIGDADHGENMDRGMTAVLNLVDGAEEDAIGPMFKKVGMTLVSSVGGASGPLYGTFFMKFGTAAGAADVLEVDQLLASLRAGYNGVVARGKAVVGDKTMVDALSPALQAMERAASDGESLVSVTRAGAESARAGRESTVELLARKGRASYLGERSIGHQDPGATSTAYLFEALASAVDPS